MSGIAGILYPDIFQVTNLLAPMLDKLGHRSKQKNRETHTYKNFQIGVIGSSMASNEKKNTFAAIDGNIYNEAALKSELHHHGYRFHTGVLSELIVHAYDLWGIELLTKLNGDFAIAILDQKRGEFFIARDRIGKKPLYWYNDAHHFIFASEVKALLATGCVPQTPAKDGIAAYLYLGYTPQDMTAIKDVNKLLPGYVLQMRENSCLQIDSFWSYSSFFEEETTAAKSVAVEKVDQLISSAVEMRLDGNKASGVFLSGGLGSATIAYYVEKEKREVVSAYTVGFQGQNDEDVLAAAMAAEALHLRQKCATVTSDNFLADLVKIVWYMDEPLADPNVLATWHLAALAGSDVEEVFSGMGSDELMAGHNRYTMKEREIGFKEQMRCKVLTALQPLLSFFSKELSYRMIKQSKTNPWQFDFLRRNAFFDERCLASVSPQLSTLFDPEVFLHKFHRLSVIKSTVNTLQYLDVKTRLVDCFVMQYEKATAAHGLQWHTPFLDHRIIEYLASLPSEDVLEESETAWLLKVLLRETLPSSFLLRAKRSRPNFLAGWVGDGEIAEIFRLLLKGTLVETGVISERWLKKNVAGPKEMRSSFKMLWSILILEIWFRLFINRPIEEPRDVDVRDFLTDITFT